MRFKFFCESVTGQQPPNKGGGVTLRPSTSTDPSSPQPTFPNGALSLFANDATELHAFFVPGQEYFFDASPATV